MGKLSKKDRGRGMKVQWSGEGGFGFNRVFRVGFLGKETAEQILQEVRAWPSTGKRF